MIPDEDGGSQLVEDSVVEAKEAEHAAAKVAVSPLTESNIKEGGFVMYKNLLQEFCQKLGYGLPVYWTTRTGEVHASTCFSIVEISGEFFPKQRGSTKKMAEMNAAKFAYTILKERKANRSPIPRHFNLRGQSSYVSNFAPQSVCNIGDDISETNGGLATAKVRPLNGAEQSDTPREVVRIEDTENEDEISDRAKGRGKKPSRCFDQPSKKLRTEKPLHTAERKPSCRETSTEKPTINDQGEVEKCPFFTMVITKTSARHSVHVPATFARSHLPTIEAAENVKARLIYKGLSWPVALYIRKSCGLSYTMIKGWQKFRKDNEFQLGDELMFELIDNYFLAFRVSVSNDGEGQEHP